MFFFFNSALVTKKDVITVRRGAETISFPTSYILNAVAAANDTFKRYAEVSEELDLFEILGMRNLSAFVGEVYVACLKKASEGRLEKNPHQDGYPDLLMLDEFGTKEYNKIANKQDKAPFSPFAGGGIEVKATCGSVPTPSQCERRHLKKPEVGDTRIGLLKSYDWKAHHRLTNNLLGILWDFKDRIPYIETLFYSSDLKQSDWGEIIQPTDGGGRTTSVSIMTREGVKKMAKGCLYCVNEDTVLDFISDHNQVNVRDFLVPSK